MGGGPGKIEDPEFSKEARTILNKKKKRLQDLVQNPPVGGEKDFELDKMAEPTSENILKLYKFGKIVGEGYSGCVRKCYLIKDESQKFAVKIMNSTQGSSKELMYFTNELNILRNIEHPNVIRYYESYQDAKHYYHIQEYCNGGTLRQMFNDKSRVGDLLLIRHVFHQAVSAVKYLHSHGICHRDIKLENFIVKNKKAARPTIKLIDFGFSKSYRKRKMKTMLGTPHYMSPEVIIDKDYGPECDNWSLGVMLYIMLVGTVPFDGHTKIELVQNMKNQNLTYPDELVQKHPEVVRLVQGLLEFDPKQRLSLDNCLLSPWFENQYLYYIDTGLEQLTKDMLMTLLVFEQKNKFQKVLRNLFAKMFLDSEELQHLTNIFRMVDFSEDGEISVEELHFFVRQMLGDRVGEHDMKKVFLNINLVESNSITYLCFVTACASEQFFQNQEYRKVFFDWIDSEGDGFITSNKLMSCFKRLGFKCTMEEVEQGLKEFDRYGDGKLTFFLFNSMFDKLDARVPDGIEFSDNADGRLQEYYERVGKSPLS